jgi:hypothetical protein
MEKACIRCGSVFTKTGNNQKRCQNCKSDHNKESCKKRYYRTYVPKGYNQSGTANNNWQGGIGLYAKFSKGKQCNRCAEPAVLTHHKDENRYNNEDSNLEALCKRCHQIHHRCWESFPNSK